MKFEKLESKIVVLPVDNIDTDQIIPARYLKAISKDGLGEGLFVDWRKNPDGTLKPDFPLNKPESKGAQVLVTGDNFGCGSSREHAPWALVQYGFRAVISTSFADIFRGNAVKNGLLPVVVPVDVHKQLIASTGMKVTIDLAGQTLTLAGGRPVQFPIDSFAKRCMLDGVDELGYMLQQDSAIAAFEAKHPVSINTLS
jgi:3-isopropylmalate/(R)-2-methylmalate dehydratase small subunit